MTMCNLKKHLNREAVLLQAMFMNDENKRESDENCKRQLTINERSEI